MGQGVDPGETKEAWDSNAITPGTPFMDLLAASLRYWVVRKLNTDPGWEGVRNYN
jgi:5'-3' exoribonuclease 2